MVYPYPTKTEAIPPKPPAKKDFTEEAVEEVALGATVGSSLTTGAATGEATCSADMVYVFCGVKKVWGKKGEEKKGKKSQGLVLAETKSCSC